MLVITVNTAEVGFTEVPARTLISPETFNHCVRGGSRSLDRGRFLGDVQSLGFDIDPNLYLVMNHVQDRAGIQVLSAALLRDERLDPELEAIAFPLQTRSGPQF